MKSEFPLVRLPIPHPQAPEPRLLRVLALEEIRRVEGVYVVLESDAGASRFWGRHRLFTTAKRVLSAAL